MPAPEPRLGRGASLPVDPTGIPEPHDILAAEEFAMPAPDPVTLAHRVRQTTGPQHFRWAGLAGLGVLVAWLARRGR